MPDGCARFRTVKASRTAIAAASLVCVALFSLVAAPAAMAADGLGWMGKVTDKDITFFCFGVIALFMLLPVVLTLIQSRLESRKERMREQMERVRRP